MWIFGSLIFLALMAEAFMGYLLPWGQMSFWGAQVIINLFSAIPVIGPDLSTWIRGDFNVSDVTLNRFFALHVIAVPLVLLGLVVAHIIALHEVGSNNPDGVEIKKNKDENGIPRDGIPFHPYYTVKDIFGRRCIPDCLLFCAVLCHLKAAVTSWKRQTSMQRCAENTSAHCAGMVLHSVLRNSACDSFLCRYSGMGCNRYGCSSCTDRLVALVG